MKYRKQLSLKYIFIIYFVFGCFFFFISDFIVDNLISDSNSFLQPKSNYFISEVVFLFLSSVFFYFVVNKRDSNSKSQISTLRSEQSIELENNAKEISKLVLKEQELKKAFDIIQQNQNSMAQASKLAKIGFWEYEFETKKLKWSDYIYEIYGFDSKNYKPEYETTKGYFDNKSQQKINEATKDLLETGKPYDLDLRMFNVNNEEIWVRNVVQPVYNDDKKIIGKRGVVQNITEEKYLRDLNKEVAKMVKIGSWKVDLEKGTVFWSEEIHELHETDSKTYTPNLEEGINFYREDFREMVRSSVQNAIETGKSFDFEAVIVTAKNNEIWIRSIGNAEFVDGKCVGLYGGFQEITEKKLAAIELEKSLKSLEDYKYSLDQSAIIAFTDQKGIITYTNDNFCKISGYSREELIGNTHQMINSKHHPKSFFVDLWKTIASGNVWRGEIKNKAKDGSYYWVDTTIVPFLNEKNRPNQYLAIRFDITERKNSAEEKNRFQKTLENSVNEIYIFNASTYKFSYVNKTALNNLGFTFDQIKELTPLDIKEEYTYDSFNELTLPLKNKEKEKVIFFTTHKRKNGSLYPVEIHLNLVEDYDQQNFIAIVLDITERKKAEEKLVLTSERLHLATTSVKMGIWDWNIVNDQFTWDDRMFELYGLDSKKFSGTKEAWQNGIHPADEEKAVKNLNDALNGIKDFDTVFRIVLPDNSIRYIKATAIVSRDKEGKAERMIGSNFDVTDEKIAQLEILKAKEQIKISETKFKSYTEKSPVAIYTTDVNGDCDYVNETWLKITGFTFKEALGKGWINALHPDDLQFVTENWYKSIESQGQWRFEYRFIHKKTKKITWVEGTAKKMYNQNDEIIGYLGTNVNITERKEAEEMYRLMANNTNDIIAIHDKNFDIKYVSPAIENILGFNYERIITKSLERIAHRDDWVTIKDEIFNKLLKGIPIKPLTYRVYDINGNIVWLETLISTLTENGEITSLVSASRDITQWMTDKKKIENYQSSLQKLTREISMIEEKQKKEIAANIHDHLSQSLVISKMRISDLEKKKELKNYYEDLDFIKNHISKALENSRKITYELSPPIIYQLGIIDALDWFADETKEKYKIDFNFTTNTDSIELTEFKSILLFRSIQEAVTNTLKYAKASLITLDVNKTSEKVTVTLVDNGKGFDTKILNDNISSKSGFGLFAVKERIRNLSGKLDISSEIGVGTKIKITIPV